MDIILASNSPRRRQLLGLTQLAFRVIPADVDETPFEGEAAPDYVRRLAAAKAQVVNTQTEADTLVIAADTTVVDRNQILGKPVDVADAERMLRKLRGRSHQVYTAIALIKDANLLVDCCASEVPMRNYREAEMRAYIASGDPLDKAGAYAIQHAGFRPVTGLRDCYANVVGLPLCHLVRALRKFDFEPNADVPTACQATRPHLYPSLIMDFSNNQLNRQRRSGSLLQ
jgi:MAF protein